MRARAHTITVPVEFEPARYDGRRLSAGLLTAALLLVAVWRITAAVDWRPPSEADTP